MNGKNEGANYGKDQFFAKIDRLDNGDKAALKREFGRPLKDAGGNAIKAFYSCLPASVPEWAEDRWFAVACFYCAWDRKNGNVSIEKRIGTLKKTGVLSDSSMHRVKVLLDMEWDDGGFMLLKLSRLLSIMKQKASARNLPVKAIRCSDG